MDTRFYGDLVLWGIGRTFNATQDFQKEVFCGSFLWTLSSAQIWFCGGLVALSKELKIFQ